MDFLLTRRPLEVTTREAAWWSSFYISIPPAFGGFPQSVRFHPSSTAFAVPVAPQQRALLYRIIGALVRRGGFIALGATALESFSAKFPIFGVIRLASAVKPMRDAVPGGQHEAIVLLRSPTATETLG